MISPDPATSADPDTAAARRRGHRQRPGRRAGLGHRRRPRRPRPGQGHHGPGRPRAVGVHLRRHGARPPRPPAVRPPTPRPAWPPWAAGPPSSDGWPTTSWARPSPTTSGRSGWPSTRRRPRPSPARQVTGHCLVLVTEDAERTMATHLGVASDFGAVDLHDGHLSSAQVVYLEGYLWEQPSAKAAMREAIEVAHANDAAVALTVSDPFCVEHHRAGVPRAAERRPRAALRQRGGDHVAVRRVHLRRRGGRRWPRPACWPC